MRTDHARRARRRRVRALTVLVAATLAGPVTTAPAAGAQVPAPTITVTPSTGVADGDVVQVDVTGLGFPSAIMQCPAAVLDDLGPGAYPPNLPGCGSFVYASPTIVVRGVEAVGDTVRRCGVTPADCAVVAFSPDGVAVGTTIDMLPPPALVLPVDTGEAGQPIRALVTGPPGRAITLAQCAAPVGPDATSSHCSPAQTASPDANGFGDVPFVLVDQLDGPDGPYSCVADPCSVVAFDGDGTVLGAVPVRTESGGLLQIDSPAASDVTDGRRVQATAYGVDDDVVYHALCDASVSADWPVGAGPCTGTVRHEAGPNYQADVSVTAQRSFTAEDGTEVTCDGAPGDCVIAVKVSANEYAELPLVFGVPDVVTVTPSTGLLAGQSMTVEASGLVPSETYFVLRCTPDGLEEGSPVLGQYCDSHPFAAPTVTTTADGTLATTVDALWQFTSGSGTPLVCGGGCVVVLNRAVDPWNASAAPFEMATGVLEATPATGLADGDTVAVAASDLMPGYDGPPWWILQTGPWAVGQCGAGVLDDTSVVGIFRQCTVPPGGGAVTVPGSTLDTSFEAQATIRPPIGDPIDCRAAVEACVAVLVRIEQDASVTLLSSPLSFA